MNRIRKIDNIYQVLITPDISMSPDSSLMLGCWTDEYLRNYHVVSFPTMNDAMVEALKYSDINWVRLVLNHQEIFKRLKFTIKNLLDDKSYNVDFKPELMTPEKLKNIMFDRILNGGDRFNLKSNFNDIINFTIVNPWSKVLHNIAHTLETYKENIYVDVLRIREKHIIDNKIIVLYGYTELGTTYEIKLIPTLLEKWVLWNNKIGFKNEQIANKIYTNILKTQNNVDNSTILT